MRFDIKRAALVLGCLALAALFLTPSVSRGDEWNLSTRFTVNHPFEVPRMVLQPNTPYVIRVADTQGGRNVVQIYNGDQTQMLTMFLVMSAQRPEPTDDSLFTFFESAPGAPVPMHEWFYPGRMIGFEFVYPKEQAERIARNSHATVLSAEAGDIKDAGNTPVEPVQIAAAEPSPETSPKADNAEIAAVREKPAVTETTPAAEPVEAAAAVQPAVEPNAEPAESEVQSAEQNAQAAQPQDAQQSAAATPTNETDNQLPSTAGELPLIALAGILFLGAGLGLRILSAKS